ncbi:MAG: ATP-dependent DNA helicase UvrD2 [Actinobacteria bacterium]|nr:ATP-dependent DNA helicase UvrD2 [Actinomycetota bacterium]
MDNGPIFDGLNDEQRRAVEAVRGPVCILAGAGSGKTTTITRRIANQVASGAFEAPALLAVTFTDKAAGAMRARLGALGVTGVRARTFHSAALAQLHHLGAEAPGRILSSKALPLRTIANSLPRPYRFRPAADLATEIEWAKNRRIDPSTYMTSLNGHQPPIPADLMQRVWRTYEQRKGERGYLDFEDVLESAVTMYDQDGYAVERFRERYHAFTVDEYQDVNLLQQSLLERWIGPRDDICVVGDDYQSIYSFTGATADHLLDMPARHDRTTVIRLESNYRSTPEILDAANRLVPHLGGAPKVLRATHQSGESPALEGFSTLEDQRRYILARVGSLNGRGVAFEDMAVLYRTNYRSEDYEELFSDAGIPFQVSGGAFLTRPAARRVLPRLKTGRATDVADQVRRAAEREGYTDNPPSGLGEQEATRQSDFGRLIRLAEEFADGNRTVAQFADDLAGRFGDGSTGRGVHLLTYHKAKGLEFEAVFLPHLEEGELPFKRSTSEEAIAEERRLLYVGMTRARRHLTITWVWGGKQKPSRFLGELQGEDSESRASRDTGKGAPARVSTGTSSDPVFAALRKWRLERAQRDAVPAFIVFSDKTLRAIADERPSTLFGLSRVSGVGPMKLDNYGEEVLATLRSASSPAVGPESR